MKKYIYGIINNSKMMDIKYLLFNKFIQIKNISYRDISIIASEAGEDFYDSMEYKNATKEVLANNLIRQQEIIEKIMNLGNTIIPMKLGTIVADEQEVVDILIKGYKLIKQIFEKIENKIEIDIVATWNNFDSILAEIGIGKDITIFKNRLLKYPNTITINDQIKIGNMVKDGLDEKREEYSKFIYSYLKSNCEEIKKHELMDDKMIGNYAVLIDKAKHTEFDEILDEMNAKFGEKINFRYVGPLAPYSSYTMEIKKIRLKDLVWARNILEILDESVSELKIKKAYHNAVYSVHPDRNPGIAGMEQKLDDVISAYRILSDYCQACQQAGQKDIYLFTEKEFQMNSILVKLKKYN